MHSLVAGTFVAAIELELARVCYTQFVALFVVLELYYLGSRYTPRESCIAPDTVIVRNLQRFALKPDRSKHATQEVHNGFHLC